MRKILVVDDENIIRESLVFILRKENFEVDEAANGREALEKIMSINYDLLITDIEMPEMKGIELLEKVRQLSPNTFVILITAYASIDTAINAFRRGASDYILKPLEFEELLHRIRRIFEYKDLLQENINLRAEINREYDFQNIIGESLAMKKVFELVKRVSQTDGTVLITGKSGTGKELIARAIHYNSNRASKKFVAINCGAIVETLFESELFGHKKGSFTGAVADKDGLFKIADGGTIFLDEVSEIPLYLQVKLLRVIEEKEVLPVGSTNPIKVDVRIITASNKALQELVEQGKFREDLFYRLNIVEIHLPSLEERKEDIALLIQHFIKKHSKRMGKLVKGASNDVVRVLMSHKWKGQVRELENIIERALIFCSSDELTLKDLPEEFQQKPIPNAPVNSNRLKDRIREFERDFIKNMLEIYQFDKNRVAKELDISVSSLYRKIDELGIEEP